MADDAMAKRGKLLEDEYFRRQERELTEKLRARAADEAARREMAQRTGVADQDVLNDLQALGYTPDTVQLLHLVPLVQIAWSEGNVSDQERRLIVDAARARGIAAESGADRQLAEWLKTRPSEAFFERTLGAIGAILDAQPEGDRRSGERDLLAYCSAIASASGGILGFGRVSDDEQKTLAAITRALESSHRDAVRRAVVPRIAEPPPPPEA